MNLPANSNPRTAARNDGIRKGIRKLLSQRPWSWDWAYWTLFVSILFLGIAYRALWTKTLLVPFINPDTVSFLAPIMSHPWLPFSPMRTAGAPFIFLIGATAVYNPIGILLAHHALWLASSAILAVSVRKFFGLKILSLLLLAYLTFNSKALSFEYYAMSEHLSRVMYVFYAAAAVATWRHPRSWRLALLIAVTVLLNVLAKPSALILVPATVILYGFHAWRLRGDVPRGVATAGFVSVVMISCGLASYATAFNIRYGNFGLSSFEGYNLFSHVGHLTDGEGPAYRDLKRELVPLLTKYRAKYVAQGIHEPNWLVYGSVNADLIADFGDVSPASLVRAYALRTTGRGDLAAMNRIFTDLAIEGIMANPREYLELVWSSFNRLIRGYSFVYNQILPSTATLDAHRASTATLHGVLFGFAGAASRPDCDQSRAMARAAAWPLRAFLGEATFGCSPALYDMPGARERIATITDLYAGIALPMHHVLVALPFWTGFVAALLIRPGWNSMRVRMLTGYAAFFAVGVVGYTMFLAFFNVAEPTRFMANIQDFIVLAMALVVGAVGVKFRRALLRLTYCAPIARAANSAS